MASYYEEADVLSDRPSKMIRKTDLQTTVRIRNISARGKVKINLTPKQDTKPQTGNRSRTTAVLFL